MNECTAKFETTWFVYGGVSMVAARFGTGVPPVDLFPKMPQFSDPRYRGQDSKPMPCRHDSKLEFCDVDLDAYVPVRDLAHLAKIFDCFKAKWNRTEVSSKITKVLLLL